MRDDQRKEQKCARRGWVNFDLCAGTEIEAERRNVRDYGSGLKRDGELALSVAPTELCADVERADSCGAAKVSTCFRLVL